MTYLSSYNAINSITSVNNSSNNLYFISNNLTIPEAVLNEEFNLYFFSTGNAPFFYYGVSYNAVISAYGINLYGASGVNYTLNVTLTYSSALAIVNALTGLPASALYGFITALGGNKILTEYYADD